MDAEKLALRRRIDTLDQHATRLHAALTECERENARLKAELETAKIQNQYISEVVSAYEKDIEKLERERDAAIYDLRLADRFDCVACKHTHCLPECDLECDKCKMNCVCNNCRNNDKWEWRGLCYENGGVEGESVIDCEQIRKVGFPCFEWRGLPGV